MDCESTAYPLTDAHEALDVLAKIKTSLAASLAAAEAMPGHLDEVARFYPDGDDRPIAARIAAFSKQLEGALSFAQQEAERRAVGLPKDRRRRRNYAAYHVALAAAEVYRFRTGKQPQITRLKDNKATSEFALFVENLFHAIWGKDAPGWRDYARWAVTAIPPNK